MFDVSSVQYRTKKGGKTQIKDEVEEEEEEDDDTVDLFE